MHRHLFQFLLVVTFGSFLAQAQEDHFRAPKCPHPGQWHDMGCHPYPQECFTTCRGGKSCAVPAPEYCFYGPKPTQCYCDFSGSQDE